MELKASRNKLRMSQARLAFLSGVGRYKIAMHEVGGGSLAPDEITKIRQTLQQEADRLIGVASLIRVDRANTLVEVVA